MAATQTKPSAKKIPVKMAVRDTAKKSAVKKEKAAASKAPASIDTSSMSIDDLIGGPRGSKEPEPMQNPEPAQKDDPAAERRGSRVRLPARHENRQPMRVMSARGTQSHSGGRRSASNHFRSRNGHSAPAGRRPMQDADVPTETVTGFLSVMSEGHGFLRPKFVPSDRDIYISQSQIRKFQLRPGDQVTGQARPPKENERYFGLLKVEKVNDIDANDAEERPRFDDLTPIYPDKQVVLATGETPISTRIIDLLAPIGFGQRGLIVSPPKAGKTTVLKEIANGITTNFPKAHLMAALIGERPEEVTDLSRSIKGEVIASHFDESPKEQTRVAEIALERAKRLVERGIDVVILLDSITRLARAYNLNVAPSGRTLSGGFDPAALYPAKKFLGAARNCETGGSLTIIGTALVDTGSRMDDLIYEEFKGTGNMELHLDRSLANKRIFPAINVEKSGTRQEGLLLSEDHLKKIVTLRNMLDLMSDSSERLRVLIERLGKTKNNAEFLTSLSQGE